MEEQSKKKIESQIKVLITSQRIVAAGSYCQKIADWSCQDIAYMQNSVRLFANSCIGIQSGDF